MFGEQFAIMNNKSNIFIVQLVFSRQYFRNGRFNWRVEPLNFFDIDLFELNADFRRVLHVLKPVLAPQPVRSFGCPDSDLALGEWEPNDLDLLNGSHVLKL